MGVTCPDCGTDNTQDSEFCKKCGTQIRESEGKPLPTQTIEAPREELTTGSTFAGRYQIIEELGKGGMGKVYKAHDTEIKEKIALKLIKPEISADKKTIERFQNELKFARKIGHRNVCRMYDLNKEEGSYYITMEYVSGEDLKSLIRRIGQLPTGKAISIAKQVAEGLKEAHRLGVIHRDLKPSNIMIDKDGNARIMDFGIARSVEAKGITGAGVMIGTPEYMPPEQAEAKEVDQRSDIYSLGVILYEMVTGRVPFEGDTALSIAMKHKGEEPKDPREFNSQISEDLSRVILRCLEKEKEKRFQSAGELRSELENLESGIPTTERVIPERRPLTSREITVHFSVKKIFIPALVVIAVVIVGLFLWQVIPREKAVPLAPAGKPSLAIMYFENNTGDESLDHWRKALSDLLITDLSQSKHIRVLSGEKLFNILKQLNQVDAKSYSSDVLSEVASQGGIDHILVGKLAMAADAFRIDVAIQKAGTGELIGSERVEGVGEKSIFAMVDDLTPKIKANFKLSEEEIAADIDKEVGRITTSSPEAYKFYSEGRKFHNPGSYRESISLMERAVEIDPEFAMAYRSMAMSYNNLGYDSKAREYLEKGFELSDRLPDGERYLLQAEFYREWEKTHDKAIEAYKKLLEIYPDHMIGNVNFGILYEELEEWDKAIERFEVCIQNKDDSHYPYYNQAWSYMAKGLYDKAIEVCKYYISNFSDNVAIRVTMAWNYFCQGKLSLSRAEVDKMFTLAPTIYFNFMARGDLARFAGDMEEAEREYKKLLDFKENATVDNGRTRLAYLYFAQGRYKDAIELAKMKLEHAKELEETDWEGTARDLLGYCYLRTGNPEEALGEYDKYWKSAVEEQRMGSAIWALLWKGLASIEMKSIDNALEEAEKLKTTIEEGMNERRIRLYDYLMGCIELKQRRYLEAIEHFKKAIDLLPYQTMPFDTHALFMNSLATAYYEAGDLEKAKEEYKRITSLTASRMGWGDLCAKSFYMLGKINEELGDKVKAIEHYKKFLDLWKDADPGIAEVEDANERLAGLKGT